MPRFFPYDASWETLNRPCQPPFFAGWQPLTNASRCCELARLAYCAGQTVRDALALVGLTLVAEIAEADGSGTYAILVRDDSAAYLVFRGTQPDDPTDIFDDVRIEPVTWRAGGLVHAGFADALARVWPEVAALLAQTNVPVIMTGHSLGAALATLAATLVRPQQLITFGSPRVGNAGFQALLGPVGVERYVGCCDIVCQLPRGSYVPVGRLQYIDREGDIHVEPSDDWVAGDQAAGHLNYLFNHAWRKGMTPTRHLADHSPFNYVSALVGAQSGS